MVVTASWFPEFETTKLLVRHSNAARIRASVMAQS